MRFDARVDLTDDMLPPNTGLSDAEFVGRVRAALQALPGANWIDVECHRGVSDSRQWLAVYEPGNARPRSDGPWAAVVAKVTATVQAALA
jgi:hypothetical protein